MSVSWDVASPRFFAAMDAVEAMCEGFGAAMSTYRCELESSIARSTPTCRGPRGPLDGMFVNRYAALIASWAPLDAEFMKRVKPAPPFIPRNLAEAFAGAPLERPSE